MTFAKSDSNRIDSFYIVFSLCYIMLGTVIDGHQLRNTVSKPAISGCHLEMLLEIPFETSFGITTKVTLELAKFNMFIVNHVGCHLASNLWLFKEVCRTSCRERGFGMPSGSYVFAQLGNCITVIWKHFQEVIRAHFQ